MLYASLFIPDPVLIRVVQGFRSRLAMRNLIVTSYWRLDCSLCCRWKLDGTTCNEHIHEFVCLCVKRVSDSQNFVSGSATDYYLPECDFFLVFLQSYLAMATCNCCEVVVIVKPCVMFVGSCSSWLACILFVLSFSLKHMIYRWW